jgi:hypothetical protein
MSILVDIDNQINKYLDGEIENVLLKKVIEEEITFSNNLENILKKFLSDIVVSSNFESKLNNLNYLICNISKDNYNILKKVICISFIQLCPEEQLFLMMNNNSNSMHNIFTIMNDDPLIGQILKLTITGLSIGLYKEEYIIKCIETSYLINKEISINIIDEYIDHNGADIISNDKLITYFLKFFMLHLYKYSIMDKMSGLISIKVLSVMDHIKNFSLSNMEYAYEIYKLGKIIIDSEVIYVNGNNYRILAKIKILTNGVDTLKQKTMLRSI